MANNENDTFSPTASACPNIDLADIDFNNSDHLQQLQSNIELPIVIADADFQNPDGLRLSYSSIPELTVARLTQAQLNGFGAFGSIGLNIGGASSTQIGLTIKLKDLQSIQIDPTVALDMVDRLKLSNFAPSPASVLGVMSQRWLEGTKNICRGNFEQAKNMKIIIVNRVEYVKSIEYNFSESRTRALQAAADLSPLLNPSLERASVPAAPTTIAAANIGEDATEIEKLEARVAELNKALAANQAGDALAGGSLGLAIGTNGGLSLSRDFNRPVAVGAGSKLTFPAQRILLPKSPEDVRNSLKRCADILGSSEILLRQDDLPREARYCTNDGALIEEETITGLEEIHRFLCKQKSDSESGLI